jgi:hypothetical protein
MAGFTTANTEFLFRTSLWDPNLKEILLDELFAQKYVDWLNLPTDAGGSTWNIPSIGQAEVHDYVEGGQIQYDAFDTGNFQFTSNKYKSSATYITNKMKQDSFYMSQLMSSFVPKQHRALAKSMEVDFLTTGPDGQTASSLNTINGGNHRFVGSGTNEVIAVKDFQLIRYALQKANVPMMNLIGIVDPSLEFQLATLTNLVNVSFNPMWEGIIRDGMSTGLKFKMNIFGIDLYISQNLKSGIAETIDSKTTTTAVANLFFSATPDILPIKGAVVQPPKVDSRYNQDFQREEYVTTCRYGFKLFRPENLVVVLTDTDQVS